MGRNDAGNVRLLIQIYRQPASLSVCWKWLHMLHVLTIYIFVPRLLSEHWPNPILQQTTIGDVFHDCLSSVFRILGSPLHASHLNLLDASKTEWHRAGQPNSPAKLQAKLQGMTIKFLDPKSRTQNRGSKSLQLLEKARNRFKTGFKQFRIQS